MQIIVFGSFQHDAIIHENEGRDESEEFEMLKILKAKRLHENFLKLMYAALNFKRNYMKSSADDIAIETEDKSWHLFQDKLYYIYLPLYCKLTENLNSKHVYFILISQNPLNF